MANIDIALQSELRAMAADDGRVRAELAAAGSLFDGYHPRMAEIHRRNAERLEEIIGRYGWPGRTVVGEDGANSAWLILQHAIGSPRFQRRCLALLEEAASEGEVPAIQVAHLIDRIRFFEGRPQIYGTQFDWDEDGELNPYRIADPGIVDELREKVGLSPLAEQINKMRQSMSAGQTQPRDLAARRTAAEEWARSVGWRD